VTITIVNGYTCETGCEVALAKAGRDPHPTRQDPVESDRGASAPGGSAFDSPAVTLGGSLAAFSAAAVAPAAPASDSSAIAPRPPGGTLDLLV
jgi:hypothetical protein